MTDLTGQGMAGRAFVFLFLRLVHLVLSRRESSTIASVHEETELVCHWQGCCSSLLCGHSPCRTVPLTKKGSKNGSHTLRQKYECHSWVTSQRISLNRNYLRTKVWITSSVPYVLNLQNKNKTRLIRFRLSSGLTLMWARCHANPPSYDPNSTILQDSLSESSQPTQQYGSPG